MANYEILLPENVEQTANGVQLLISVPSESDDRHPNFDPLIFFLDIKGILDHAFHTVDNVLLGTPPHQGPETQDFESYSDNSSDLLCKLQQISSEMAACKLAPGGGNELKTTISILNMLSSYTWAGKAVLVIAAFALNYGDFWGLAQLHSLEKLAESVGITNRVPSMSKRPDLKKCQKVIEVRKLIENTMEVIKSIVGLDGHSKRAKNFGNILSMTTIAKCIPVHVFWAVVTIVASTTQMCCLSSDEDITLELSPLSQKMKSSRNILEMQIEECVEQGVVEHLIPPEGLHQEICTRSLSLPDTGPTQDDRQYTFDYRFVGIRSTERFNTLLNEVCHYIIANSLNITVISNLIEIEKKRKGAEPERIELYKGTRPKEYVVGDTPTNMLKVLEKYKEWIESVKKFGFDESFKNCYNRL